MDNVPDARRGTDRCVRRTRVVIGAYEREGHHPFAARGYTDRWVGQIRASEPKVSRQVVRARRRADDEPLDPRLVCAVDG